MAEITLKICMGTMCYVMGGAELRAFIEMLPESVNKHMQVSYSPCLGMCDKVGEPPYVELNGRVVAGVSKNSLLQMIKEALNDVV